MAEDDQSDDRTEAATARHLDQAREEGNVPVSREMATFASLSAVVLVLGFQLHSVIERLLPQLVSYFTRASDRTALSSVDLIAGVGPIINAILPILAIGALAGAAAVLVQTRFLVHLAALEPKMSRVNPMAGMKRLFGLDGLIEVLRSLIKLGLFAGVIWVGVRRDWRDMSNLVWQAPNHLLTTLSRIGFHILIAAVASQGIVAGVDFAWVRFRHARDMRMSKQDVRDELKDTEGNPHVKGRLRRIMALRARQRMMAKVPTATVVVTNPTHYAVALAYDRSKNPAPRIVAKGADLIAARIREIAGANNVPIVANPPLARALYRLDLDTEIPADYYKAVAEIIAYVWRMRHSQGAVR